MAKEIIVEGITRKMVKRQFLENETTRSLGNKLLEDKILELDLCVGKCRYGSVPRFVKCYNMPLGLGYFYMILYSFYKLYLFYYRISLDK